MPAPHPRLTTVVEPSLYEAIELLAHRERMSLSQKVRDLLLGALEIAEDTALDTLVEQRRKVSKKSYSLAETKHHFKIR